MHKCVNNSTANVYHLEQMVGDFFPYSQEQLGFDKPATIVFQSDEGNSSKMLGKTAHYDPGAFEVVLYVDGRHPKDVMRSLSHELVHHAQNCRGDFAEATSTEEGYAQNDPHLRNMEREAYTKGNLIFRDYEDLIKTGKKEVDIDFTKSGEPKMSLKEWKNNEINTKLMKKWGLLKEGCPSGDEFDPEGPNVVTDDEEEGLEEGEAKWKAMADAPDDPTDAPTATALQQKRTKKRGEWGQKVRGKSGDQGERSKSAAAGSRNFMTMGEGDIAYRDDDEEEGFPASRRHDNPMKALTAKDYEGIGSKEHDDEEGNRPSMARDMDLRAEPGRLPGSRAIGMPTRAADVGGTHWQGADTYRRLSSVDGGKSTRGEDPYRYKPGKISVKEAKQITRRIIERVRKEGK